MKRTSAFLIFGIIALVSLCLSSGETRAQSMLTICNDGKETLEVAMIWQSSPFFPFVETWRAQGWNNVAPGCFDVLETGDVMEAFISVVEKTTIGERIMHFGFQSKAVQDSMRNGVLTAERFFCVANDAFDRQLDTLQAHESCPSGYYLQLFNLYVTLDAATDFTLTLNKP